MEHDYAEYVLVLKALSDVTRMQIVDMLSGGEMCACNILEAFEITQPTLSYHMKILTQCGIVDGRREGAWMHYEVNSQKAAKLMTFMRELTAPGDSCNKGCSCANRQE